MTRILSLDQASKSGWAFGTENTRFAFGSFKAPQRFLLQERLGFILDNTITLINEHQPDEVHYEAPWHPNPNDMKSRWETITLAQKIEACILLAGHATNVPAFAQASGSWRKSFLGYGRRPKGSDEKHMKEAAVQRCRQLGYAVTNTDEADAIGILWHALHGTPGVERMQGNLLAMAEESLKR